MNNQQPSITLDAITWHDVTDVESGYNRIVELVAKRKSAGAGLVTVLVPTVEASSIYKEEIAERGGGFGTRIEAFDVWLADMWELHGDGRRFVDAATRGVLCALALHASDSLTASPGAISLMSRLVADGLPLLVSEHAERAELSDNEREMVRCAKSYRVQLMEKGLVEPCEAARVLAEEPSRFELICSGFDEDRLEPLHKTILSAAKADVIRNLRTVAPDEPRPEELTEILESLFQGEKRDTLEPTGALRVVLPAGLLAEERIIIDTLVDLSEEMPGADIALVAANPEKVFYDIAEDLVDHGISVALKATKPISETGVGRALAQARILIEKPSREGKLSGTELLSGDVVGTNHRSVFSADSHIRKNRLIDAEEVFETISGHAPHMWGETLDDLSQGLLASAFGKMSAAVMRNGRLSEGYRREQEDALSTMKKFAAAAERENAPLRIMADAMEGQSLEVDIEALANPGTFRVEVMGMEEAASRRALSFDALLICQMTSEDRPVRDRTTSRHVLMEKLGEPIVRDPLGKERRTYYDALATAKHAVILERSRHNADADPAYPSAMFEETTALYRGASKPSDEGKTLGIPDSLIPFTRRLDETRYVYAVTGRDRQDSLLTEPMPATGEHESNASHILLPKKDFGEQCASASAIEKYLECPYLWFVQNRLNLDKADEILGAKEFGTFVHEVLRSFHVNLSEAGHPRVTKENVDEATAIMSATFDEVLAKQASLKPKSNRYAVSAQMEKEKVAGTKRRLLSYVGFEASLLPGFKPLHHELKFGYDSPVYYAGLRICGSIDRIDVDAEGNAVVIDYKTGKIENSWLSSIVSPFSASIPEKVQLLIYAQIARRTLGVNVVGLAYLNPMSKTATAVYDPALLGYVDFLAEEKLGIPVMPCEEDYDDIAFQSIEELIDWAEDEIAPTASLLAKGCITPSPKSASACKYCPAMLCERRLP